MSDEELERQAELYMKLKDTCYTRYLKRCGRNTFGGWLKEIESKLEYSNSVAGICTSPELTRYENAKFYLVQSRWKRMNPIVRYFRWRNSFHNFYSDCIKEECWQTI